MESLCCSLEFFYFWEVLKNFPIKFQLINFLLPPSPTVFTIFSEVNNLLSITSSNNRIYGCLLFLTAGILITLGTAGIFSIKSGNHSFFLIIIFTVSLSLLITGILIFIRESNATKSCLTEGNCVLQNYLREIVLYPKMLVPVMIVTDLLLVTVCKCFIDLKDKVVYLLY